MKRGLALIFALVFLINFASAICNLDVSLINQDPYPAVPGEYVNLVFQVEGVEDPACTNVFFELLENYPVSFDPGVNNRVQIKGGTFTRDYSSFLMVPYKVRVDTDALEGDNPIEINYGDIGGGYDSTLSEKFNLRVEDVKVDFEVHVKEYDPKTNTLTLEILNIGDNDVEALSIEIPEQDNINVKGSNINIVGALDSNDYTTADFEAVPKEGQINLEVHYTDEIGERRTVEKTIHFNPSAFEGRNGTSKKVPTSTILLVVLVLAIIIYWFLKKRKAKKKKHSH